MRPARVVPPSYRLRRDLGRISSCWVGGRYQETLGMKRVKAEINGEVFWNFDSDGGGRGGRMFAVPNNGGQNGIDIATNLPNKLNDLFIDNTKCTVLAYYRDQWTTNNNSTFFGYGGGAADDRVLAHAPFGDGNCYWDFGNATAGSGRISVAWTKTLDYRAVAFVAGPNKGREIWSDGVRLAADASATATRPTTNNVDGFRIGSAIAGSSDYMEVYLFAVLAEEWPDRRIIEWSRDPIGYLFEREPSGYRVAVVAGGGGFRSRIAGGFILTE